MTPSRPAPPVRPLLLLTLCSGCSDYTFFGPLAGFKGGDTGDTGLATEPLLEQECWNPMPDYFAEAHPGFGWEDGDACGATNVLSEGSAAFVSPGNSAISDFSVEGWVDGSYVSAAPGDGSVRLLQAEVDRTGSSWQVSFDEAGNFVSDDISASGPPGAWSAATDSALGSLDACRPNCEYVLAVEIRDPLRAASAACAEYQPLTLCVDWVYDEAMRMAPMNSTCVDGEGDFSLVPRRAVDHDGDGALSATFVPLMTAGTGQLTNAAWITSAKMLIDEGQAVRIMKSNAPFRFGADDMLGNAALVSRSVGTTTTHFPPGVISGGAPLVAQEIPASMPVDLRAHLKWTCASLQPQEDIVAPQGYTFTLADVGCDVAWPQKFTVRPEPTLGPTHLSFQWYGNLADMKRTPLNTTQVGAEFYFGVSALRVAGTLLSDSPADGALIDIAAITWDGIPICTPGVYLLPGEE